MRAAELWGRDTQTPRIGTRETSQTGFPGERARPARVEADESPQTRAGKRGPAEGYGKPPRIAAPGTSANQVSSRVLTDESGQESRGRSGP